MNTLKLKVKSITKIKSESKRYDIETEKNHCFFANDILVHNSQFILAHNVDTNETIVSSKGLLKNGLTIEESDSNSYWIAAKNDDIITKIRKNFTSGVVQVFGEVVPVQSGYSYGQTKPTSRLFDVRHNGDSIPYDLVAEDFKNLWVPVVFDGVLNLDKKEVR